MTDEQMFYVGVVTFMCILAYVTGFMHGRDNERRRWEDSAGGF